MCKIYKNYCFPNESCQKGKKQATKFHINKLIKLKTISTFLFSNRLLEVLIALIRFHILGHFHKIVSFASTVLPIVI